MSANKDFAEQFQVVSGFVPVDMADGANDGDWVNFKNYGVCTVIFFGEAGTSSDDPTLTELMADPTRYDRWRLRTLIGRHARLVDSSYAREILANFEDYLPRFIKIMPVDYRRALEQRIPAEAIS